MIVKITDEKEINELLKNFKTGKDNNPFTEYLAYKEDEIKGFISYSIMYELVEINYIFVKEKYRNQKVASTLLEHLIDMVKDLENITLEVNVNNELAINLYKKYGFVVVSKREHYYGSEDALLMLKKLGD